MAKKVKIEDTKAWAREVSTYPDVSPNLLAAIATVESGLNPMAISSSHAMGLFQFMPITIVDLYNRFGTLVDPFDPKSATVGAKKYTAWLFHVLSGKTDDVLAAWNWGYGNLQRYGRDHMPQETKNFIQRVKKELERLKTKK